MSGFHALFIHSTHRVQAFPVVGSMTWVNRGVGQLNQLGKRFDTYLLLVCNREQIFLIYPAGEEIKPMSSGTAGCFHSLQIPNILIAIIIIL